MSTAKHTAGPWTVKNDYDERHIVIANIDGESFPDGTSSYTYDFVCDTYGDGDDDSRSREVADANARLIAAAPDMLAMLRECRATFAFAAGDGDDPANDFIAEIDAVLAKAEGR